MGPGSFEYFMKRGGGLNNYSKDKVSINAPKDFVLFFFFFWTPTDTDIYKNDPLLSLGLDREFLFHCRVLGNVYSFYLCLDTSKFHGDFFGRIC